MPFTHERLVILKNLTRAFYRTVFAFDLELVITEEGANAKVALHEPYVFVSGAKKGLDALSYRNADLQFFPLYGDSFPCSMGAKSSQNFTSNMDLGSNFFVIQFVMIFCMGENSTMILRTATIALLSFSLFAQAPKPVVGTVTAADAAARTLTIKADDGTETKVKVADAARVAQIPPGETSLQNAKPAELSAVTAGDRVLARGAVADGTLSATLVVLMSKTDIARKQQQETAQWATKGVSGIVTAVDKAAKTVTINSRGTDGVKPVKVTLGDKTVVKRYAEGSIKYSDAVASTIDEIEVNDQLRALGTRGEDGTTYAAEQAISGAFRNIAATVKNIDAAAGVVEVTDLDTKKSVFVKIGKDTNLRKLEERAASMMAMAMNGGFAGMAGGMAGGAGRPQGAGAPAGGAAPTGGAPAGPGAMAMRGPGGGAPGAGGPGGTGGPGPGGMRRPGGGDMMGMAIDRSPAFQLAELKKNDPLILSVSKTKEPNKVVAITILAGVEPILATPANGSRASQLGTWNLDGGAGAMGGGGGGPQ